MRFVEPVTGKLLHQVEDFLDRLLREFFLDGTLHKAVALLSHLFGIFLAHRTTQQVGFAKGVAGKHVRDLHHLFLVNNDAQRFLEQGLKLRQLILDLSAPPFALDEVVDHSALDRPRSIERVQRREVRHRFRLITPQHVAHPVRFELEYAGGQRAMKNLLIRPFVIERNRVHVQFNPTIDANQPQRFMNHRQRRQAEEVHLQQADLVDGLHVVRGDNFVVLIAAQRHQVGQRLRSNHHTGGVHARATRQAFQLAGNVDQLADLRVVLIDLLQRLRLS